MPKKKALIIEVVSSTICFEVRCPYCNEYVYVEIDEDVDKDYVNCEECKKEFIVDVKEWASINSKQFNSSL